MESYIYRIFNMKTSRANSQSFRLHHVSKANSTRKSSMTFYNPDDTFKLAALNSVTRGVKYADLSFVTGNSLNKLRVQPLEANDGQYNSAHDNLTEVRIKYDEIKKQRVGLQDKIDKMKEQIGKFGIFKQQYEDRINQAKSKGEELKAKLEEKKSLLEMTSTEKKVLLSMESRYKSDKVFYDQRKFDLEQVIGCKKKQLNIYRKEGHEFNEGEDRSNKVYERLAAELEEGKHQREMHIRNLELMIEEKLQLIDVNQQREADLVEIAERAMQDKDYSQKQWRKILLTHIFVNKMLRRKIQKQMEKFRVVEFAFKEIKTATGVNDAKTLVTKYLNKEAVYGKLLSKIADNQKSIEQLKNQTEALNHQSKQLEMEKEVLQSIKLRTQDLHDDIKGLQAYDERAVIAEAYQNKMALWVTRQLKKFNNDKRPQEQHRKLQEQHKKPQEQHRKPQDQHRKPQEQHRKPQEHHKNGSTLVSSLQKLLQFLSSQVDNQAYASLQLNFKEEGEGFGQKENQKNTRVVPKRSRKNTTGEQIFDVDEQQLNPTTNIEQQQQINSLHEQILRENDKFMRQVRKRKEEEKKILLQKKQAKPKEGLKVVEPKKEE